MKVEMDLSLCKKTSLIHRFASFNGISWIFEDIVDHTPSKNLNPFNALSTHKNNNNLACCNHIKNIVDKIVCFEDNPEFKFFFLPTPYESYHLTYLDGINASFGLNHPWRAKDINKAFFQEYDIDITTKNIDDINHDILRDYLSYVENTIKEKHAIDFVKHYDLPLQATRFLNWKNNGICVEFDTTTSETQRKLKSLFDFKQTFGKLTEEIFGFKSNSNMPLHMTIGYFSFPPKAEHVFELIAKGNDLLKECPPYYISTARHCPFTTMAHYFI